MTVTTYRVIGRYMSGREVAGYELVGEDGSRLRVPKDRATYMIGRGLISNMRVQTAADGSTIIRGKGIDLSELPAYDLKNERFRDNAASKNLNNEIVRNNAKEQKNPDLYTIRKRIMKKTGCIGYELSDVRGKTYRLDRQSVLKLASERLLSNARVQRYIDSNGQEQLVLRGTDGDLKSLPVLVVDNSGKIIDPTKEGRHTVIRVAKMKGDGAVIDLSNQNRDKFYNGDYIVVQANGTVSVMSGSRLARDYTKAGDNEEADCDMFLDNVCGYAISVFGSKAVALNQDMVSKWLKVKKR